MSFIYIGSPYSNGNLEQRYRQVLHYCATLMRQKKWCYSPIVYCHEMAKVYNLPKDTGFWAEFNFAMMEAAIDFHILQIEGWQQSQGLAIEIAFWKRMRRPQPVMIEWKSK